jgi:hypothetical protein
MFQLISGENGWNYKINLRAVLKFRIKCLVFWRLDIDEKLISSEENFVYGKVGG